MATKKVSELAALTSPDGAEELLINDGGTSKKITIDNIFNQDIDVTGTVTADGLTVDGDATISDTTPSLLLMESDTTDVNTRLLNNGGDFFLATINDAKSAVKQRLSVDHATGDIAFYEDTGTTAKLFWDASTESLGIGTTSPSTAIQGYSANATGLAIEDASYATIALQTTGYNPIWTLAQGVECLIWNNNTTGKIRFGGLSGNSTKMTIASDGSVGIGVTPDGSVYAGYTNLQLGANAGLTTNTAQNNWDILFLTTNTYFEASAGAATYRYTDEAAEYQQYQGTHEFKVAPSGTADAAITWTTAMTIENDADVTIETGNLVIGTAGKGIDFSATADGTTMTSELLDDYEEGTWTPAYSTTGGSFTYDAATAGFYTKVGNIVHVHFRIYTLSATVGTGNVTITGLPFTTAALQSAGSIGDCRLWGGDTPDTLATSGGSTAIMPFYRTVVNGANSIIQASDLSVANTKNLIDGQVTYTAV